MKAEDTRKFCCLNICTDLELQAEDVTQKVYMYTFRVTEGGVTFVEHADATRDALE